MRRRLTNVTRNIAALTVILVGFSLGFAPGIAEAAEAPTIAPSITCDAQFHMTIAVQIDGVLPEHDVVVKEKRTNAGGSTGIFLPSQNYAATAGANQVLRLWVVVDGTTAYDSGELYASPEAGCGVSAPAVGDGITITPSSTCVDGGVDYGVAVDAHQLISYDWWAGDLSEDGSVDVNGTDTIHKVIPTGSAFRLLLDDFLDRRIFDSESLASTVGSDCSAPVTQSAEASVTLDCVDETVRAVAGGTNTGNSPLDVAIRATLNGTNLPTEYGALQPGESLTLAPIVVVDTDVVTVQVETAGDKGKQGPVVLDSATVTVDGDLCDPIPEVVPTVPITTPTTTPSATTVPEPTATTLPGPIETTVPVATTTPTTDPEATYPTTPTVEPITPASVEAAGTVLDTAPRESLPRTGSDVSGPVALGLGLLAAGAAMAATARRAALRS